MSEYSNNNDNTFDMAGIRKNTLLDRWEFLWGRGNTSTNSTTDTRIVADDVEEQPSGTNISSYSDRDNNIKSLDNIDFDALKLSSPISSANQSSFEMDNSKQLSDSIIDNTSTSDNNNATVTKKKKKKKKSGKNVSAHPSVKWGCVEQICFTRSIGYDRIPTRGCYPIALGQEVERVTCSVDQLFYLQQLQLMEKAQLCGIATMQVPVNVNQTISTQNVAHHNTNDIEKSPSRNKKTKSRSRSNSVTSINSIDTTNSHHHNNTTNSSSTSNTNSSNIIIVPILDYSAPLETRQFDYKSTTNPLFHSVEEDKRIEMLTKENISNDTINKNRNNTSNQPHHHTVDSNHSSNNSNSSIHSHTTSNNNSNNIFTEVNNEIKLLKSIRGMSGCDCKHIKADKLSIAKLKSELITNGHYINYDSKIDDISKLSKIELLSKVKEVLKYCDMCISNDCECIQQGIQCSAQLCGCLRSGYHPGEAQSCANPEGRDLYDPQRVKEYRLKILSDLSHINLNPETI